MIIKPSTIYKNSAFCYGMATMTRFYTRRGDHGITIMGSKKLSKDDPLFDALGGLDELNSWLAVCRSSIGNKSKDISKLILAIQETLFIAQAEIAAIGMEQPTKINVSKEKTDELESKIAEMDKAMPEITKFIIPGGSQLSSNLDYARAIARRAERGVRKFDKAKKLRPELIQYINRLSSILFAMARYVNYKSKIKEQNPSYK